jgi:hypothetical protein
MSRITVSVPEVLAKHVPVRARDLNRSVSAYVSMLIADDLRAAGLVENGYAEKAKFWAKVRSVAEKNPDYLKQIQDGLPESTRRRLGK